MMRGGNLRRAHMRQWTSIHLAKLARKQEVGAVGKKEQIYLDKLLEKVDI